MENLIRQFAVELETATRERDAAVEQLRSAENRCDYCLNCPDEECEQSDYDCESCGAMGCLCRCCKNGENWRWKGAGRNE